MKQLTSILRLAINSQWRTMTVKNTGLQVSVGSGVQSFLNNLMNNVRQRLNSDSFNNENNLCLDGVPLKQQLKQEASENNDLFDLSILFAAPKKKVRKSLSCPTSILIKSSHRFLLEERDVSTLDISLTQ